MRKIDYRLYLVTDRHCLNNQTLANAVEQAILGGVTLVQLREKQLDSRDFYQQAITIKQICHRYQIPLIINDRLDIAQAVDADGVHLGQSDLPAHVARQMLGQDKIIGVSARTVAQAVQAQADGADYLGVGAMFATPTKQDANAIRVETVHAITQAVDLPMVLIGGINETTLPTLITDLAHTQTAVNGVAVVSAILGKADSRAAASALTKLITAQPQIFGRNA